MADQTILITGASGLLGSALIHPLRNSERKIRFLVREESIAD
jgi:uncharacterized protein YbjT (DUF2867 family)